VRQSTDSGGGPGILRVGSRKWIYRRKPGAHHQDAQVYPKPPRFLTAQREKTLLKELKSLQTPWISGQGNLEIVLGTGIRLAE
jgi:hypothetical protein